MKTKILIILSVIILSGVAAGLMYGDTLKQYLQSEGYIAFTPDEAVTLAYKKCGSCHTLDKVTKYCFRCGAPFIVVIHNMKTMINEERKKPGREGIPTITNAEGVAIAQVWNALIGNWEEGWRKEDLRHMLKGSDELIKLLDIPPSQRPIESALQNKSIPGVHKEGVFKPGGAM